MTTRRRFLQGATAAGAWGVLRPDQLAAGLLPQAEAEAAATAALPNPATAPFEHVVVLMFENRSFDHILGWLPGSDGVQKGRQYTDRLGVTYPTYPLGADTQGCGYLDPDHSWEGFVAQHNKGALDGWLRTPTSRGAADTFPIGYYGPNDIPALGSLARSYTVLDRYFASFAGETFPNRFYQHAARTDRDHNLGTTTTTLGPTIWDRLAAAGRTGAYYFFDEPFLALWGTKYLTLLRPVAQFLVDCALGTLPNVSFVDPSFINEDQGQSGDYHPHGDIRAGEAFLSLIYHAVRSSPAWNKTVFVVNFDEWGGFFDHVAPPKVVDDTKRAALTPAGAPVPDYTQLGFRVPCIVASPWSKAKVVHDGPYEHTSVLKMIEWRWGLPPLTARDANARNLAEVLDFSSVRTDTPDVPVLASFVSLPCAIVGSAKSPPAPVPKAATSTTAPAPPTTATAVSPARGLPELPATGGSPPLLGVAAALGGGMAILAANRRAGLAEPAAQLDPVNVMLGLVDPPAVAEADEHDEEDSP
jgi:phospholipase C